MRFLSTFTPDAFIIQSTELLVRLITESVANQNHCILGLSGGSTPKPIYEALGKKIIDWDKVSIFLVDDRYIASDHSDSNQKLIRDTLLQHATIPEHQIIFPNTSLTLDACVTDYDERLHALLNNNCPYMLTLGLGSDGHIASLFPPLTEDSLQSNTYAIHTTTDQFAIFDRISVPLPIIQSAESCVFFLKGEEKKHTWEEMINSKESEKRWPATSLLQQESTQVISCW